MTYIEHVTLKELTRFLEHHDPDTAVPLGFTNPHSYRGYYEQLAFEPVHITTVGAMLTAARSALGATYQGWKGGEFTMDEHAPVWLAQIGSTGEPITRTLLEYMVGKYK